VRDLAKFLSAVWESRPDAGDQALELPKVPSDTATAVAGFEWDRQAEQIFDDIEFQSRGGKGIITMKTGERTGDGWSAR